MNEPIWKQVTQIILSFLFFFNNLPSLCQHCGFLSIFFFLQVITADGEEFLASMPLKFRKHVWIKRGDYVVTEPIPEGNKVKAEIVRILMKDHIRHLRQCNMWPDAFTQQQQQQQLGDGKDKGSDSLAEAKSEEDNAGYESESSEENDSLEENPNRQTVSVEDSEDSSETETDTDDELSYEEND